MYMYIHNRVVDYSNTVTVNIQVHVHMQCGKITFTVVDYSIISVTVKYGYMYRCVLGYNCS